MKLNVKATGLSCGIFRGGSMLLFALLSMFLDYGTGVVEFMGANGYLGYSPSLIGGLLGLVWGFADGFVCGVIFARLYNLFLPKK